jgi:ketosteroid isomerase-like protein
MDHAEAVALIEKRRDAWLSQDLDTYLSLFAEDFVFYADGQEQTRGRAALEDTVRRNYERFDPVSWEFYEKACHGQNVLAEWTVTLKERATGSVRSLRAMFICEIRGGLTTWVREYRWPTG